MKCAVLSLLVASVTGQLTLPTGGNTNGRNNNGRTTTTATTANGVTTTTTFVTSGRDSGQSVPMAISFGNGAGANVRQETINGRAVDVLSGGPLRVNSDGTVTAAGNTVVVDQAGPPADCKTWFDGCNTCAVGNGRHICTEMACKKRNAPYCQEYASGRACSSATACVQEATPAVLVGLPIPPNAACNRRCPPEPPCALPATAARGACRYAVAPTDKCGCHLGCGTMVCSSTADMNGGSGGILGRPARNPQQGGRGNDGRNVRPEPPMQNPNGPTGAFGTTTNMPGAPVQNGRDPEDPVQVADGPFLTASDGTIMLGAPTDSADALNRATDCTLTSITFALTPIGSACAATDLTNPRTFCKSRCYRLLQGTPAFMQCLSAVGMETMAQPLLAALTGCEAGH